MPYISKISTTSNMRNSKSFFYSKLDKFHRPRKFYKHVIGTAINNDELIFEEKDETFTCGISLTSDEKFFIISTSDHITTEEYFFHNFPLLLSWTNNNIFYL